MDVQQGHTALADDPIEFLEPDVGMAFLEDEEEGGVLREGVGEFDVTGA